MCADGCASVRSTYLSSASAAIATIHLSESLLFLAYVTLVAAWYLVLLRPYTSQVGLETARVATLLSLLPKNVDLQKLMAIHYAFRERQRASLHMALRMALHSSQMQREAAAQAKANEAAAVMPSLRMRSMRSPTHVSAHRSHHHSGHHHHHHRPHVPRSGTATPAYGATSVAPTIS